MEAKAHLYFIRLTPRKAMLVADLIRGKNINEAFGILKFSSRKRAAKYFAGVLKSAVSNYEQSSQGRVNMDALVVSNVQIGKGPTLKRFRPRAMGRAHNLMKKTCHISIKVGEK
jgi:large subunit ribosomal protein L22